MKHPRTTPKAKGYRLVQPTITRAEARYLPPFEYQCTAGHQLGADRPVHRCPVCPGGEPCPGQLVRVGQGSRSKQAVA